MKNSVKVIVFCLVVTMCLSKSSHQHSLKGKLQHHQHKKRMINMNKAGLHTPNMRLAKNKVVDVKELIIKKSQEFLNKQNLENQPADKLFNSNPAGRYDYQPAADLLVASGEVYTRVIQKGIEDDNMSVFAKLQYKLNDDMLYVMNSPDDYREVQYGFNLLDVPMKSDRIAQAQCCARIEPSVNHVEITLYNYKGYCFRIDLTHQNWLFCDDDVTKIMDFRKILVDTIIKAWFKKNLPGQTPSFGISESQCQNIPFSWSVPKQLEWPCKCSKVTSIMQSPIGMGSENVNTKNLEDASLALEFTPTYSINYGLIVQEPEFHGQFGAFSFITEQNVTRYEVKHIVFKIGKGEHFIADQKAAVVGELHIHGNSANGNAGVLAVQMIIGKKANPFLDTLNIKKWNYQNSFTGEKGNDNKVCLKGINYPNPTKYVLKDFFTGKAGLDTTFYKYTGSLTKPPCTEHVEWYILSNAAEISSSQLENLKQYGLNEAQISPDNIRSLQNINGRTVYYSAAVPCPEKPPSGIIEPPNLDYKYIKMSHTLHIPAMADQTEALTETFEKMSDKDNNDQITLSPDLVLKHLKAGEDGGKPEEISEEQMKVLIAKFLTAKGMSAQQVDLITKSMNKGASTVKLTKNDGDKKAATKG